MATSPMTFPGTGVNPPPSFLPTSGPISGPPPSPWGNPGNLPNPNTNIKDITRNTGLTNLETGQIRNELLPQFANLMMGYAGPAGDFFRQLMQKGSPFYQQRQREGFEQGVKDINDQTGVARQQLSAAGYGATPSGATAGMIGGMATGGAQSLAEQYLQNLFQNENLMVTGAQDMSQLAAMFNPANLFGNVSTPGTTQGPSAADQVAAILGSLKPGGKAGPVSFGGN